MHGILCTLSRRLARQPIVNHCAPVHACHSIVHLVQVFGMSAVIMHTVLLWRCLQLCCLQTISLVFPHVGCMHVPISDNSQLPAIKQIGAV